MNPEADIQAMLVDPGLASHFRHAGPTLVAEMAVLGIAVQQILAAGNPISNKNIISRLLAHLEDTHDAEKADVIRKTIEIVVGHTLDDI